MNKLNQLREKLEYNEGELNKLRDSKFDSDFFGFHSELSTANLEIIISGIQDEINRTKNE